MGSESVLGQQKCISDSDAEKTDVCMGESEYGDIVTELQARET